MAGKPLSPHLRFAVLFHDQVEQPHYDLLLQVDPAAPLWTWRFPSWPVSGQTQVQRQPDHRTLYLDYEGEISHKRGRVKRVDAGFCQFSHFAANRVEAVLHPLTGHPLQLTLWQSAENHWIAMPKPSPAET